MIGNNKVHTVSYPQSYTLDDAGIRGRENLYKCLKDRVGDRLPDAMNHQPSSRCRI